MTNDRTLEFYALLDAYNNGVEPLENWETEDLVKLINLADIELQNREFNAHRVPIIEDESLFDVDEEYQW